MKAISISSLRKEIREHLDYVSKSMDVIIVSRNKEEDAIVIMSIKEYNALKETEHLLASPANRKRLDESLNQLAAENTIKYQLKE